VAGGDEEIHAAGVQEVDEFPRGVVGTLLLHRLASPLLADLLAFFQLGVPDPSSQASSAISVPETTCRTIRGSLSGRLAHVLMHRSP